MASPLDTSSSESDSDSSCDDGRADEAECAPEITKQLKGTPVNLRVCCFDVNKKY